ncbi:MAG: hypothetical protein J6C85_03455 [Alphaproteobacteria bacterium]|nr:hypothetical protein [Alphaproteobacteria bacterium]
MPKHIKIAVLLLCLALPFSIVGLYKNNQHALTLSRGNYFFEKTRNTADISSIVLNFNGKDTVSLVKKEGIWRVKEADDYYASLTKTNALLKLIYNTFIHRIDELHDEDNKKFGSETIQITSYNEAGDILDLAIIAAKDLNNKYHYAKLNQNDFLYQLDGDFSLSAVLTDWLQMPILQIAYNQIKRITTDNFDVYRRFKDEELKEVQSGREVSQMRRFANYLWYLNAIEVRHAIHFKKQDFKLKKSIKLTTLDGIIYRINLFSNDRDYWLNIELDRERLLADDALFIINENKMLYDGWFFKINPETGEGISTFSL